MRGLKKRRKPKQSKPITEHLFYANELQSIITFRIAKQFVRFAVLRVCLSCEQINTIHYLHIKKMDMLFYLKLYSTQSLNIYI